MFLALAVALIIGPTSQYPAEGIYRYGNHPQKQQQVIVYKNDLTTLLESITWLHLHGFKDTNLTNEQLCQAALHRKISIACGDIVRFTCYLLKQQGYQCRPVYFCTAQARNGYDDGHAMLEVFHNGKWILVDIDARRMFWSEDHFLDATEMMHTGFDGITLVKFSEAPFCSYGDMNGYDLYAEKHFLDETNLRAWYKRICQTHHY